MTNPRAGRTNREHERIIDLQGGRGHGAHTKPVSRTRMSSSSTEGGKPSA
jgi:hypothetical protein